MFLDIGLGIIAAILASSVFQPLTTGLLAFCIGCALLPDVDFVYFYPKRHDTKYDYRHRDLIHYPLLYLPIGSLVIWMLFGSVWAVGFFLSSLFHFIHDSIAIGWGIKWLYPFSDKQYAFLYLYSVSRPKGLRQWLFVFDRENLPRFVKQHGDPNWVKNIYGAWHPIAQAELLGLLLALVLLCLFLLCMS